MSETIEPESIEDYREPGDTVVETGKEGVVAQFSGEPPAIHQAVRIGEERHVFGHVVRHVGSRRAEILLRDVPNWIEVGTSVAPTDAPVGIPGPRKGVTAHSELDFVPLEDDGNLVSWNLAGPALADISGERTPLDSGYSGIDRVAPLVAGGVNLIIDETADSSAFAQLVRSAAPADAVGVAVFFSAEGHDVDDFDYVLDGEGTERGARFCLKAGLLWAAELRETADSIVFVAELPAAESTPAAAPLSQSLGEIVDLVGSSLVSTAGCSVTSFLRLPTRTAQGGLGDIVETLSIGDVDAQIFLEDGGTVDLRRSLSKAPLDRERQEEQQRALAYLVRAEQAREKMRMWGDEELTERERSDLQFASELGVTI